ncbi:TPA: hypothetical protein U1Z93_001561 [Streptococcus suis]|nr:hypothetical protein [Streptococcus suis]HEM4643079.1 hypothetical protein [Streptococcus suis]
MKFFRELKTDYLESRFSAHESFAEWFLKHKLGFGEWERTRLVKKSSSTSLYF